MLGTSEKSAKKNLPSGLTSTSIQMNIIEPLSDTGSGYCIQLANGQGWHIAATIGTRPWVDKLATIMQLDTCNPDGYPKIIFIRKGKDVEKHKEPIRYLGPNMQGDFPGSGWKAHKFAGVQVWHHHDVPDVICEMRHKEDCELDILRMLLALYPIFERAQDSGGLPLHAALIKRDRVGILLAASQNIGKSTCCRRIPRPWQPLCDDEALVVRDNQERYLAHPFPTWSDYLMKRSERTWNIQSHVPLVATLFLEQAEKDELIPIGQGQAAVLMYQSATQVSRRNWVNLSNKEMGFVRKKLFDNACELARTIPAYRLCVSLEGRFWEEIEKVLS